MKLRKNSLQIKLGYYRWQVVRFIRLIIQLFARQSPSMLLFAVLWFAGIAIALPDFLRLLLWLSPAFRLLLAGWAIVHLAAAAVNLIRRR